MPEIPVDRLILIVLTVVTAGDRVLRWFYQRETSEAAQGKYQRATTKTLALHAKRHHRLRRRVDVLEAKERGRP